MRILYNSVVESIFQFPVYKIICTPFETANTKDGNKSMVVGQQMRCRWYQRVSMEAWAVLAYAI